MKKGRNNSVVIAVFVCMLAAAIGYILYLRNKKPSKDPQKAQAPAPAVQKSQASPVQVRIEEPIFQRQRREPFKQLGLIYSGTLMLPLFGRPTFPRSFTYHYYTVYNDTASSYGLRLALQSSKRACMETAGCKEVYDGDTLYSEELDTHFTVKLYNQYFEY